MPKRINYFIILLLPALFLWAGSTIELANYGNDPNYIYLANAASICDGKGVGHVDNPGTTVMEIGAIAITLRHLLDNPNNETLVQHVLKEPLIFVNTIHLVFVVFNALILFLLGYVALKKTGSIWVGILLQTTTFLSANTLDHVWTKISPEPILFFLTCLYVITLLFFYTSKERLTIKYLLTFAALTGAGLATKATFLPLVLFPFILFPGIKKKIIYLGSLVFSFILFTIPAIPEYKRMFFWFRNMLSHTGKYGQGDKGLLDISTYLPNLIKIIQNNPVFGVVTIISIITLIYYYFFNKNNQERNKQDIEAKILLGLTATNIFGILLVAKQYSGNHYLIPVILLTGISLLFNIKLLIKSDKIVLPILVSSLIILFIFIQPKKIKYAERGYRLTNEELQSTQELIDKRYSDYTPIYYYPYSLNKFSSLKFGDVHTQHRILPHLNAIYPNTFFYNYAHEMFQSWNSELTLEEIVQQTGNKILFVGGPRNDEGADKMIQSGIPLVKIYQGRVQGVYELDSVKFQQKNTNSILQIAEEIVFDAEQLSMDNQFYLGSDKNSFGNAYNRTNEQARSGKYAVKMDSSVEYAIYYELKNLNVNEVYEISIWRKADNNSGRLVVSAKNDKSFYKSQHTGILSDKQGWELLRVKLNVPPELQNDTLKIYLWNPKGQLTYFDDLSIIKYVSNQSVL
ncbi:hypothetical protein [uncultured Draconibacterium sp.]|uniref:hypothetical protein n=1 Tax=uncultured Draconibacterium sp. TaxID=1573823 RepID=UPI00325FF50C